MLPDDAAREATRVSSPRSDRDVRVVAAAPEPRSPPMPDSNTTPRLQGRRILITGASSGVGLAAATAFAREGAELVLVSRTADRAAEHLAQLGVPAIAIPADVTDREAVDRA